MLQMKSQGDNSEIVKEEEKEEFDSGPNTLAPLRPSLTLPPRFAPEAFMKGSDLLTPSPMTFVASLFSDQDPCADPKSFSQLLAGAIASPPTSAFSEDASIHPRGSVFGDSSQHAAASGFTSDGLPPRINTARFKSIVPPRLPVSRSSYLTIPPGLSPTTFLESPVLLPTRLDTSAVLGSTLGNQNDWSFGHDGSPSLMFKPLPQLPNSPLASMGPYGLSHRQVLAQVQAQANSQIMSASAGTDTPLFEPAATMPSRAATQLTDCNVSSQSASIPEATTGDLVEPTGKFVTSSQALVPALPLPHLVERPSEDGYNWRKYGQKNVKNSEYPRSYYKCTHPGCPVKKKVERNYEGQITEIVYRSNHNHPKPQSTRKNATTVVNTENLAREGSHFPSSDQASASYESNKGDSDKSHPTGGLTRTPEPSLASTSDDDAEDAGDDDSDRKRIKLEKTRESTSNHTLRTIREQRVVVQTPSDVDILDDGYRWRKYGQKVVKGNPHPRSYYKCTNVGCPVRKHVERSSTDPKSVVTAYEGKHNHEVPAARNSNHEINTSLEAVVPANTLRRATGWGMGQGRGAVSLQEQLLGSSREVDGPFQLGSSTTVSASNFTGGEEKYRQS